MTLARLIFLLSFISLLAACGQRGPLYLPDEEAAPIASQPVPDDLKTEPESAIQDDDAVLDGGFEDNPADEL